MSNMANDVVSIDFCGQELLYYLPNADDHIQKILRAGRRLYEEDMLVDSFVREIPPGLIIDVGANIGNHTVFFAKVLRRQVIALEPWAKAFHVLWQNVALNDLSDYVKPILKAAGAAASKTQIRLPPEGNWGQASIDGDIGGPIDVVRLDDLGITEPVALIKIDVEGMELDVLEGACELIEHHRPVLYVEAQTARHYAKVRRWLRRFDYEMVKRFNYTPTYAFASCDSLEQQITILLEKTDSLASVEEIAIAHRELSRELPKREMLNRKKIARQIQRLMREHARELTEGFTSKADQTKKEIQEDIKALRESLEEGLSRNAEKDREVAEQVEKILASKIERVRQEVLSELSRSLTDGFSSATEQIKTELRQEIENLRRSLWDELDRIAGNDVERADQVENALAGKIERVRHKLQSEPSHGSTMVEQVVSELIAKMQKLSIDITRLAVRVQTSPSDIETMPIIRDVDDSATLSLALPDLPVAIRLRRESIKGDVTTHAPVATTPSRRGRSADPERSPPSVAEATDLVSVIMTTYNSERYVEPAIRNMLEQTHANLELLIVDDASTDGTFQIITRIAHEDSRIRTFKMFKNRGTYWCKNFAILHAKGRYVTFQDSDDESDACRIALQLGELTRTRSLMCTCNYMRVDSEGHVVLNRGRRERKAIMAPLLDKEKVIRRAGYFDSVRTSADDEFTRRIGILIGSSRICHVNRPLYRATVRDGSLTNATRTKSKIKTSNGSPSDDSFLSPPRQEYVRQYASWHESLAIRSERPVISFPQLRRPFPIPLLLAPESQQQENYVTASMASIPARETLLEHTVRSIIDQVDVLNVYLNGYDRTPLFLKNRKIRTVHSSEHGDRRDNGKFFFLDSILWGYHFTIDDDIVYPPDYVQRTILKIEQYNRQAIVGCHGVILANPFVRFMEGRQVFHFKRPLDQDRFVNLLGTGTTAYHTSTLQIFPTDFREPGMADVWLAVAARRQKIPLIAIQRPNRWLVPLCEADESSLYTAASKDDGLQTAVIQQEGSWSLETLCSEFPLVQFLHERFSNEELTSCGVDIDCLICVREDACDAGKKE